MFSCTGPKSAIRVFDPVTIQPILQLIQDNFQQSDHVTKKGQYRVFLNLKDYRYSDLIIENISL